MSDESGITVAISGPNGLVGSDLRDLLNSEGHRTIGISRTSGPDTIEWDPETGVRDPAALEGVDAVVHLAGENIAGGRWNAALKQRIMDSRVNGTRSLVNSLRNLERKPRVFVCASAIGFYGDRGDEVLDENSPPGEGFLAETCVKWEAEARAAEELGIRVVCVRIGVVLSPKGGALQKMLLPFKLGGGGIVGNGRQYWSCIGLTDLCRIMAFCVTNDQISGPVNAVLPEDTDNRTFTKTLGKVLGRPTIIPLPSFAAKLVLGEMAEALLLASSRVRPTRLQEAGFSFTCPDLHSTLTHELSGN
jgi:uncharacterized protein (TIGR01777 family)